MSLMQSLCEQLKLKNALLFPRASMPQIQTLSINLVKAGFTRIPHGYMTFLQVADGLTWNGVELFSCVPHERAGTVFAQPDLLDYQQKHGLGKAFKDYLILGRATECLICYHNIEKNYQLLDRNTLCVILKFPRFQDVLYHIITTI